MVVMITGDHTSTVKIVHAVREVTVGSMVEVD
jgi:hypothetical protein